MRKIVNNDPHHQKSAQQQQQQEREQGQQSISGSEVSKEKCDARGYSVDVGE
jgi:hypothetical protein